jgi:hypothetical protein
VVVCDFGDNFLLEFGVHLGEEIGLLPLGYGFVADLVGGWLEQLGSGGGELLCTEVSLALLFVHAFWELCFVFIDLASFLGVDGVTECPRMDFKFGADRFLVIVAMVFPGVSAETPGLLSISALLLVIVPVGLVDGFVSLGHAQVEETPAE